MALSVKQQRKKEEDRRGTIMIGAGVVVLVALFGGYFYVDSSRVDLDKATFCPEDGAHSLTVVLLDRTDPLSTVQRTALRGRLEDVKQAIPRYGALQIYSVGPIEEKLLRPVVDVCNPGRGADINPAIGNARTVERHWRERFAAPLDAALDELVLTAEAPSSPIMESIQSIAISAFQAIANDRPKRLIVVSDMLQHGPAYSHYSEPPDFERFRQSAEYRKLRADLSEVEVEVIYLRRETRRGAQGANHVKFWRDYFEDLGGRLTHVVALEG